MKLYSRRQLFVISVATGAIAILLAVGFGVINVNPSTEQSEETVAVPAAEQAFEYQTSTSDPALAGESSAIPVTNGNEYTENEAENIRIYEQRQEGVVNITTETVSYNWFLEPVPREGNTGSGSIIDKRGYVLTNHHVVEKAFKVYVSLSDGTRVQGEVVGTDAENDLAVVKFDPEGHTLITIPMGTSSNLRVGQKVLAIGNPFALDRTLTTGIVSGLGRPIRASNNLVIRDMIQTDASINPGNSGGPLLDSHGNMIGINTMIYSPSGGSVGIGFAVPVDTARRVVPDLIQYGRVRRGWIDIVPRQIFEQLVQYADLPVSAGVLVSEVVPGGNADQAGIKGGTKSNAVRYGSTVIYLGGDIIVEVDGTKVASLANLYEALEDNKPGEKVNVVYMRGKKRHETSVVLSERPEQFQWD